MAYITYAEYNAWNPNNIEDGPEFTMLNDATCAIIDRLTMNKIRAFRFNRFTADIQERIKKASYVQIDTLISQGGIEALAGQSEESYNSVKIGKYSESRDSKVRLKTVDSVPISPMINFYLQPTGLLNRAINKNYCLEDFNEPTYS